MNRKSDSFVDKVKKFMNPPTQHEKSKRDRQLKDVVLFSVVTTTLFLFRRQISSAYTKILESN